MFRVTLGSDADYSGARAAEGEIEFARTNHKRNDVGTMKRADGLFDRVNFGLDDMKAHGGERLIEFVLVANFPLGNEFSPYVDHTPQRARIRKSTKHAFTQCAKARGRDCGFCSTQ